MEQCILKFVFQYKALCLFYVMLQSGDVHRSSKPLLACCTSINLCSIMFTTGVNVPGDVWNSAF